MRNGHVTALITDRRNNPPLDGTPPPGGHQRSVALLLRDRGHCRFPGCTTTHVEAHHIKHWLHGGPTDIDNLILLCTFHHGVIHDRGYGIRFQDGILDVYRPDGVVVPDVPPPPSGSLDQYIENYATERLHLADSLHPSWGGEDFDLDHILTGLLPPLSEEAAA